MALVFEKCAYFAIVRLFSLGELMVLAGLCRSEYVCSE
jgi:hypothetical protein